MNKTYKIGRSAGMPKRPAPQLNGMNENGAHFVFGIVSNRFMVLLQSAKPLA